MGYEGGEKSKLLGLQMATKHKRSKSFPDKKKIEENSLQGSHEASNRLKLDMRCMTDSDKFKKKQSNGTNIQSSLQQEILQLQKRLQDQFEVRRVLETALGLTSPCGNKSDLPVLVPKPATELIREIAVLELEVVYLEQYLLSLYRKAFDQQISSASPSKKDERLKSPLSTPRARLLEVPRPDSVPKTEDSATKSDFHSLDNPCKESGGIVEEKLLDSGVHRCHSSLSHRSAFSNKTSPPEDSLGKALRACHSQPLSMMEYAQNTSNIISLAEHLGTQISDHLLETPNKLSEDMIKCMAAIYCKLVDPPLMHNGLSSPGLSMSSVSSYSPHEQYDLWSPGFRNNSSFDVKLDNPFHVDGLKEFSGPYSTMVEVPWIYRDGQKVNDVEPLLQNFKSLISQLEQVDPRKLEHEEKLAFWINIHNALVMHAYLAYGIPQNNIKRLFLLLKAAYNVGGHTISADTIQSCILGCRVSRPGQWLRLLISSKAKFKTGDERQGYAIEHPEPLLHFALCSGNHSDPAVRMYTPKRVFQELEAAKEEYIRATFGIRKDQKILLPKVIESFAKDSSLCPAGVIEMVQQSLPESVRRSLRKLQLGKSRKSIEWIPHNFTFRYLISKELVR